MLGLRFIQNGNLLNLRYEKNGALIRRFEWDYDDSNNRQSQLEVTPTKAIKWEYGFDWFDRLVSVRRAEATTVAGLPTVPLKNLDPTYLQREYVFDESDNRKFFDDHVNGKTYHYKYKSIDDNGTIRYSDQLEEILTSNSAGDRVLANFTSLETFEHDADGNMTKRIKTGEEITFQWSDYDRLLRVESDTTGRKQDNRYDFNGIRKRKLDKNGNSSREYTAGISTSTSRPDLGSTVVPTISYLSIGGAIVGYEEDDGTTSEFRFFLTDALSTVRDIVDDTGAVIKSQEFGEYGNELSSSGSGANPEKTWVGGLSVNDDRDDSGLWLMGHRHYLGEHVGRFISRDPIGFAGGLNMMAYAGNNPVNEVDPEGLESWTVDNSGRIEYFDRHNFSGLLRRWQKGGLKRVIIGGHGDPRGIYPEVGLDDKSELASNYIFVRNKEIEIGYADFTSKVDMSRKDRPTKLVRGKRELFSVQELIGKAEHVELRACRTGKTNEYGVCLAKQLSKELPGTRVHGDESYCGGPLERDGGPGLSLFWSALESGELGDFLRGARFNSPVSYLRGKKL